MCCVLTAIEQSLVGLLLGAGATAIVMKINVFVEICLRLVIAIVLGLATDLGVYGVWLSWPIVQLVQIPLLLRAFRRGDWAVTGVSLESQA